MSIFGPRSPQVLGIRTFGSAAPEPSPRPGPPPMLVPPASLYDKLLRAAMDAELAQVALEGAKRRCEKGPTEENRRAVILEAANALDKEIAFDELWEQASNAWLRG